MKRKNPRGSTWGNHNGEHCIPGIMAHLLQEISTLGKDLTFARRCGEEVQTQNIDFMVGLGFFGFSQKCAEKALRSYLSTLKNPK